MRLSSHAHKPVAARVSLARRDSRFLLQFPEPLLGGAGPCGLRANDPRLLHPARWQATFHLRVQEMNSSRSQTIQRLLSRVHHTSA